MEINSLTNRYNELLHHCWLIEISEADPELKEQIMENLGGCKHWMEVYNRNTNSTELREGALRLYNEYETNTKKLLEIARNEMKF